tara:strand:+ start:156 stop:692 length:537 start_codon:yes stop_codon:yes gene_type:complete
MVRTLPPPRRITTPPESFLELYDFGDVGVTRPTDTKLIELFTKFYNLQFVEEDTPDQRLKEIEMAMTEDYYLDGMENYMIDVAMNVHTITEKLDKLAEIFKDRPANEAIVNMILEELRVYYLPEHPELRSMINNPAELYERFKTITAINVTGGVELDTWNPSELGDFYDTWVLFVRDA